MHFQYSKLYLSIYLFFLQFVTKENCFENKRNHRSKKRKKVSLNLFRWKQRFTNPDSTYLPVIVLNYYEKVHRKSLSRTTTRKSSPLFSPFKEILCAFSPFVFPYILYHWYYSSLRQTSLNSYCFGVFNSLKPWQQ